MILRRDELSINVGVTRRTLEIRDGAKHKVDLGGTNRITGILTVDGTPWKNRRLRLARGDIMFHHTRTDDEGNFEFCGTPPGHWPSRHS